MMTEKNWIDHVANGLLVLTAIIFITSMMAGTNIRLYHVGIWIVLVGASIIIAYPIGVLVHIINEKR